MGNSLIIWKFWKKFFWHPLMTMDVPHLNRTITTFQQSIPKEFTCRPSRIFVKDGGNWQLDCNHLCPWTFLPARVLWSLPQSNLTMKVHEHPSIFMDFLSLRRQSTWSIISDHTPSTMLLKRFVCYLAHTHNWFSQCQGQRRSWQINSDHVPSWCTEKIYMFILTVTICN